MKTQRKLYIAVQMLTISKHLTNHVYKNFVCLCFHIGKYKRLNTVVILFGLGDMK